MEILFASLTVLSALAWVGFRHSFFVVPFVLFLSLWVEDFFPLSHFPMYSDPDESENYFYVASIDEGGETRPIPIRALTEVTAPKIKKMYKSWVDDYAAAHSTDDDRLTEAQQAEVGGELLTFLRDQAVAHEQAWPEQAALVEVWIVYGDEGFRETPRVVATLPPSIPTKTPSAPGIENSERTSARVILPGGKRDGGKGSLNTQLPGRP